MRSDRTKFQYSSSDTATMFLPFVPYNLGAVPPVLSVSHTKGSFKYSGLNRPLKQMAIMDRMVSDDCDRGRMWESPITSDPYVAGTI